MAVITHEHQDHLNGITETNFEGITIGETWLAWTEDPTDELAKGLGTAFTNQLAGLVAARNRLAAEGSPEESKRIDRFLEFELGWDSASNSTPAPDALLAAAGGGSGSASHAPLSSASSSERRLVERRDVGGRRVRLDVMGGREDVPAAPLRIQHQSDHPGATRLLFAISV